MVYRIPAFISLAACALALPAAADLRIPLGSGPAAAEAAKKRTSTKVAQAAPSRSALASRSLPAQIGVRRRGGPPILPPADGAIPPEDIAPPAPAPAPPAPELQRTINARLGRMLASSTDAYRMPDPRSQWVGKLKENQQVAIVSQWQGWYAIVMADGSQAYVPQTHVEVLPYQVRTITAPAPAPPPMPVAPQPQPVSYNNTLAEAVIREAFEYADTPYVWGGNTQSGVDCSGLVRNCFAANGVKLPRRASEQFRIGTEVPLDQLQPGDRLYFSVKKANDHTGIYIGDGKFIHASRSRGKVGVDHLSTRLYHRSLTGARRL
jgi:cell wall-associated NlpC family hydrolase